jgi:hypothetical protein
VWHARFHRGVRHRDDGIGYSIGVPFVRGCARLTRTSWGVFQ